MPSGCNEHLYTNLPLLPWQGTAHFSACTFCCLSSPNRNLHVRKLWPQLWVWLQYKCISPLKAAYRGFLQCSEAKLFNQRSSFYTTQTSSHFSSLDPWGRGAWYCNPSERDAGVGAGSYSRIILFFLALGSYLCINSSDSTVCLLSKYIIIYKVTKLHKAG